MQIDQTPVLLTSSAIAHDPAVALSDRQDRIALTLASVAQWRRIRPHSPLVLCDGSSYDFTADVARLFPAAPIECLVFENPQNLVKQYGRGYGEGEIVRYAVQQSKYIQTAGAFAKCSAKLWVSNFQRCLSSWNGRMLCKGVFLNAFSPLKRTQWLHVDTRFYVASTAFYTNYFLNAHHQLGLHAGEGLEECFKRVIEQNQLTHLMFQHQPIVEGTGGGMGRAYRTSWTRRVKEQWRLGLVRGTKKYKKLF